MMITIRDELGILQLEVDDYGIQFLEGIASFTGTDGQDYDVPVNTIVNIYP